MLEVSITGRAEKANIISSIAQLINNEQYENRYNDFNILSYNYAYLKGHQSTDDLKTLQRENDDLKKNNRIIAQELEYYRKKESQQRCTKEVKGKIDEVTIVNCNETLW